MLIGVGVAALALSVTTTLWLAERTSLDQQQRRAVGLAEELLHRADRVSAQLQTIVDEVRGRRSPDPCSDAELNRMRKRMIQSNLVLDVAYMADNRVQCSSFGRNPFPVGPPTYVSAADISIWTRVEHPLYAGAHMMIAMDSKTGVAALVHEGAVLDMVAADADFTFGLIGVSRRSEIIARGAFDPAWWSTIGSATEARFFDGTRVVGWKRSAERDYAAYVAIPRSAIDAAWARALMLLLPIGLVTAAVLAAVAVQLLRLQSSLPAAIRAGLRRQEFFLHYQPIVDLATGRWIGAEALLRWRRASGELVSPDVFVPAAEESQLIGRITDRRIDLMENEAGLLLRRRPDFHFALYLSAQNICNPALRERLRATAAAMGVATHCIHREDTERVLLRAEPTRQAVDALRAQGQAASINDFGTGYPSRSYLTDLTPGCRKIDRCFVATIGHEAVTSHVIGHIIAMGQSLRLNMIAEGIETEAQAQYLRDHGVQQGQGWLFARPMSMAALRARLREQVPADGPGEAAAPIDRLATAVSL